MTGEFTTELAPETTVSSEPSELQILRQQVGELLDAGLFTKALSSLESLYTQELEAYLGHSLSRDVPSLDRIQTQLQDIEAQTRQTSVPVYVLSRDDRLDLTIVPPSGEPIHRSIPEASKDRLVPVLRDLRINLTNPRRRNSTHYLAASRQLYEWIITPLEADLERLGADTLLFSMDAGLRSMPVAALHDGRQFLIEKYSVALIPSFNLTKTTYQPLQETRVLAMGASVFPNKPPLPAVPLELSTIAGQTARTSELPDRGLWPGEVFLNEAFTLKNLTHERQVYPFGIIHLATHAEFKSGDPSHSYIQLWNDRLSLDRLEELNWRDPPVELLVLSACRTAVGDKNAELGFAGLAVQAGVKSALASLWYVSDEGTLALMSEFYRQLRREDVTIKAEALRRAQIAMLRGEVFLRDGQLVGSASAVPLPPELAQLSDRDLSHPYYWSSFTTIGSPW